MNGSVPSRWSRLARVLRPTAVVVALPFVLQACGSNPKPETGATPKTDVASAPAKPEPAPKPAPTPTPAPTPAPAPAPEPAPPPVTVLTAQDSAARAAAFCQQIMTDVVAAMKVDSGAPPVEPDSVIRKVASGLPDSLTTIAMMRGERCKR